MASKRAVQLLTQRCNAPSVIGRDVSMRLGMHAARAMSTASRSRVLCVGAGSRVRGVRKEQGVVPQRRWDSSTAASSEGTGRMYDFDDVRTPHPFPSLARLTPLDSRPHLLPHPNTSPHRRPRTPRIRRCLHPYRAQHPHFLAARRVTAR